MKMRAARMYGYKESLRIEEVPVPEPKPDEILLKVAATGMCRSDYQLLDGYFEAPFPVEFPYIPGHEVTGRVVGLRGHVPSTVGYSEGDMVVVNPGWGDGTCRQCREGNEQLCSGKGRWVGFGPPGGFAEYIAVEYRHAILVSAAAAKAPEFLAPMTDAGMTPYRGMKKLRDAGKLGPGRTVAVTGIGGLGSYAVQYAKLLGSGATVVALARQTGGGPGKRRGPRDQRPRQVYRGYPGRTAATDRPEKGRRHPGLCRQHGIYLNGVRPAGPRRCTRRSRPHEPACRAPTVPLRRHGAVLLRFLLGQPPGPRRGALARRSRPDQAQRHHGQARRHQRTHASPGSRRRRRTPGHRLRLNGEDDRQGEDRREGGTCHGQDSVRDDRRELLDPEGRAPTPHRLLGRGVRGALQRVHRRRIRRNRSNSTAGNELKGVRDDDHEGCRRARKR